MLKLRVTDELVELAVSGDVDAFGELVVRYEKAAWLAAWRVLREHHSALDATQNAFVEAYRNLAQLRNRSQFAIWLMRIAHREAIKLARKINRNKSISMEQPAIHTAATTENDELTTALASLPEHERLVIVLKYFDGHSAESIARLTGRPVGTVTKQISRGIARLKSLLRTTPNE